MHAVLSTGERVAAMLGTHCWGRGCADAPAPPADELPLVRLSADGAGMTVEIEGGIGFVRWSADYRPDGTAEGILLGEGGAEVDPDSGFRTHPPVFFRASFESPPAGNWLVTMAVNYQGGGDGLYFWHVIVR